MAEGGGQSSGNTEGGRVETAADRRGTQGIWAQLGRRQGQAFAWASEAWASAALAAWPWAGFSTPETGRCLLFCPCPAAEG